MKFLEERIELIFSALKCHRKEKLRFVKPVKIPLDKWNDEYKEILTNAEEETLENLKELMKQDEASIDDVNKANDLLSEIGIQSLNSYFKEHRIEKKKQDTFKWENAWRIVQAVGAGSIKERAINARTKNQLSALLSARNNLYLFKNDFDESSKDPRIRIIFADKYLKYNPGDFWTDIKTSGGVGKEGGVHFPKGKKPEQLIRRIIDTVTLPGELVLDSFAGSGTTAAVAHKMGRRWIAVELGDQCHTHIIPRLNSVIDGTDQTGVTEVLNWKGGGGFRYYRLAPSMLEKDKWGNWVISKDYNAGMLTEAMCKHMGFTYAPDESHYWMHGHSTETDFIYVTTSSLTHEQLRAISEEVGPNRTLLICCKAFNANAEAFDNLTLKKIPQAVLTKCEWGKDDYSLNVAKLEPANSDDQAEADLFTLTSEEA
jgi:adenine-specific DNA-methyltransferase